jgi:hypothetical protein
MQTKAPARESALDRVYEADRAVLMAGARVEAARRELDAALDAQREARSARRAAIIEARRAGETLPAIAAVLRVSPQRVHALAGKSPEVRRR